MTKTVKKAMIGGIGIAPLALIVLVILLIVMMVGAIGGGYSTYSESTDSSGLGFSKEVLEYKPIIEQYAEQYHIPDFVQLCMAVMEQESHGQGLDPMQSSECGLNEKYPRQPGGITEPEYSIDVGVHYLSNMIHGQGLTEPSDTMKIRKVLAGYNTGSSILTYFEENQLEATYPVIFDYNYGILNRSYDNSIVHAQYPDNVLRYYSGGTSLPGVIVYDTGWAFPVVGDWRITQPYKGAAHTGVDIGAAEGTPVVASKDGVVSMVQEWDGETKSGMQSYGNCIDISHDDNVTTRYAHLSEIVVVPGQPVVQGQLIGYVGNTGNSFGSHLHFEYRPDGVHQDPNIILKY